MTRFTRFAVSVAMSGMMISKVLAGEATTTASASNGWWGNGSTAATANWNGSDGGEGFARTRTDTAGNVNLARGLAVGFDRDGLDFSFSHAIAPKFGPAYAGTLNLSIGRDGEVSGSYGGVLSTGGSERSASAGGSTRADWRGATATASATGHTSPNGSVVARTNSYSTPHVTPYRMVRTSNGAGSYFGR